ncbi:type VII secretion target [Actinoplanes sp. L3-i22]|uniref:type VII secretion target n=1 Tax=Actinoplanes sp. L3-i22 TaxID=2836373 RepID=UPI001C765599|nr:type VII secretion target [Actinoplanes sp. L3-i22]BCY09208.1 hypothetical protein L3i22_042960 [Actinoplanes sp. L3-i22]
MTLNVDPEALRIYATHLAGLNQAAQRAKDYVNKYGALNVHQQGLIGKLVGFHDNYVDDLNKMLDQLAKLLESSGGALTKSAASYENTDRWSASQIDDSLPQIPRAKANPPGARANPSRD